MTDKVKVYVLYTYEQNPYRPDDYDYIPYETFTTYEEAEAAVRCSDMFKEDEYFISEEHKYTY